MAATIVDVSDCHVKCLLPSNLVGFDFADASRHIHRIKLVAQQLVPERVHVAAKPILTHGDVETQSNPRETYSE